LGSATVIMGSQRSKEDDVLKISTSIFVTNFPDRFGAKDLWNTCKPYGHVVDTYIPDKRSKAGIKGIQSISKVIRLLIMGSIRINLRVGKNGDGTKDEISLRLLGKVKDFASLTNLKVVLANEGYTNIELKYMGGFWVMIVFQEDETMNKFRSSLGAGGEVGIRNNLERQGTVEEAHETCFHDVPINQNMNDNSVRQSASHFEDPFGGEVGIRNDLESEGTVEEVPETCFDDVPINQNMNDNSVRQSPSHSEDPFGIYAALNKKREKCNNDNITEGSLKYPSGFTPNVEGDVSVVAPDINVEENRTSDEHVNGTTVERHDNVRNGVQSDTNESNCTWVPSGMKMLIVLVYDPQEFKEKKMLWDYLLSVVSNWDGQVVIMGDFNKVRDISERFGSVFNKKGAEVFNNFITNADLVEVPLSGCSFTWCHKSAKKMSKLDRFLISDNLRCACPNLLSISLDRFLSDHRPILMRESHGNYGPTPFKNFHYWFEIDGFDKFVEELWKDAHVNEHNPYNNFMKKLKLLKEKIRMWISIYKERTKSGKRILKTELEIIDSKIDIGDGNDIDVNRRYDIVRLIQDMEKVDALEMAQKAKIKWAIEGDENSKYYHGVINKKRGRLAVCGVMADSTWIESPNSVKEFFDHFKNRFDQPSTCGIQLVRKFSNRLSIEQNELLEGEVSNAEIKSVVWDCGIDKEPEPDGFTFGFYRRYWSFIENDVVDAIKWFFVNGKIPKGGNIVNEIQFAFVANRKILDGPFILNELVQWCKKKKKQTMVFKVDFEKAYDSVRWDFLDTILKKFGFGERWCNWIQNCLQSSKGVVDVGLFKGIRLSPTFYMSHLFYGDDAIFTGQWNQANIDTLIRVLDVFYRASGLRINISKSKLLGISVEASKLEHAAAKIRCAVLKTLFIYLGSRVGDHMSRIQSWNEIIEGMVSRLSKWKVKMLSIGGRLTLLKSVLGVIPIYHMSIFKMPMKVLQNMEAIRDRFFNGLDINTRKPCWVSWKEVMASKDIGGLGVSSMFALNRALLFKWVCRFISQKNTIWAKVFKALHGEDGKIGNHDSPTYPSVWLTIIQEVESLKAKGIDLSRFIAPILAPRIYALETMKDIVVASKLSHNDLESSLRRQPRDEIEQAQLVLIKNILEGCILNNSTHRWAWNLGGSGEFSVSSVRKYIDDHLLPSGAMKTRWIKEVPIKINVHAWKVKNDGFPTRFNLSWRGMEIDSITCPLCDRTAESTRHLFFSCKVYCDVMRNITRWWELDYRDTNSYGEWLEWLISIRLPLNLKKVFEVNYDGETDTGNSKEISKRMGIGRVGFARVLVEVTANKALPTKIKIVYKNGHSIMQCGKNKDGIRAKESRHNANEEKRKKENPVKNNNDVYDENEVNEIQDMKNKEKVERFIVQKKAPTKSENTDMISYYKQRKAQMIDKGEEDNYENNSVIKEMDDVYKDDTGIAECMKNDDVKAMDKRCRIMIAWNSKNVTINLIHNAKQSMFCKITTINGNKRVLCTFVYAANDGIERRRPWKDLQIQKRIVGDKAWIMMGDMNVTLTPNEHSFGGLNMNSNMNELKESVNSIEMKDIASSGLFFTWTKNLYKTKAGNNTGVLKKLDIVMGNEDFIDNFSQAHVIFLFYLIFNHCPIVTIWPSVIQAKNKSFKFANFIRDRNNAYFFRVLKSRNHKSRINHIRDSEGNLFYREKVPNQFVKHFQEFLGKVIHAIDFESSSHLIKKKLSAYAANFMIRRHIQDNILLSQEPLKGYDRKDGLNRVAMESFRYFKGGRGLRHGDPLSPYIFTLVMEMLSLIVQDRVEKRKEFKYHFRCKNLKLTYVCFADDLLMFCNGDKGYASVFKEAIKEFGSISGLLLNYNKSTIIFGNMTEEDKQEILECVPFKVEKLPTVITDINRLLKGFLWNQRELFKGKATVAWKEIYKPKSQGGMGLKDLGVWNNAMIAKHLWHVATEKVSLWEFWGIVKHKIGANYPELEWNELVDLIADLYSGNSIDSIIRRLGLAASVYLIWKERNCINFQGKREVQMI
nr:RNA-directed DNA polymerase, eukaryota, reverse transcriptase zinc-binding domain protein [Tanacetum cinerariifolium]